jgi:hypothetical protein
MRASCSTTLRDENGLVYPGIKRIYSEWSD